MVAEMMTVEELSDAVCEQAAHVHAATSRLLALIAEFERRRAYEAWGCATTAQWLSWRCGIGPRAAREQVRVARTLEGLPEVRAAFASGRLSYSKVRALCRMATPQTESDLVANALVATAAQLEKVARCYRRVKALEDDCEADERRGVRWWWDDDGSLVVQGRLPAEAGARLIAALEQRLDKHSRTKLAEAIEQRRADALVELLEEGAATELVVHVDAEVLADPGADGSCHTAADHPISGETARRLACDGVVRRLVEAPDGTPLDVGRRTRVVPTPLRRALQARDDGCVFPGCGATRWTAAHHVRHWANGGPTALDNLVTLCGRHHRLIHLGHYNLTFEDGIVRVHDRTGRDLTALPRSSPATGDPVEVRHQHAGLCIDPATPVAEWGGERPDYRHWIDAILRNEAVA